jgi:hypothetical protein
MTGESKELRSASSADGRCLSLQRPRRIVALTLLVAGIALLAISLLGDYTSAGRYVNLPPRPWERYDDALASRTPDLASLYLAAQASSRQDLRDLPPRQTMEILYGVVADRFTHGDRATYNPFSNWVLWALGSVSPRHAYIQDPDALLRYGHSALCGEISFVLLRLAAQAGIRARHALLNGHIVMEAWYDGDWHAYDPDLESNVVDEEGNVLSVDKAARRPDLLRKAYAKLGTTISMAQLLAIYTNIADDVYVVYPATSFFAPVGHWPGRIEQAAGYARFGIPVALLVTGVVLLAGGRSRCGDGE